jgi:transcriptional regulator with XRE-family HTH domain
MMTRELIEHWRALIAASGRGLGPLSKALGMDRSYLSEVLAGRTSDPGVFTSMKLASELGITFEALMRRDNSLSLPAAPNYQRDGICRPRRQQSSSAPTPSFDLAKLA